jgi:S1-C subfamily serine protease
MSRLLAFIAGAVSVGAVIGVLAIAGVVGGSDSTTVIRPGGTPSPIATSAPADGNASVADIYARVSPAVVFVQANSGKGQLPFRGGGRAASGSGFVIDNDGHIVTNDHVVADATQYRVRFGSSGDPIVAKLLGTDLSAKGGLRTGDRIVEIAGTPVHEPDDVAAAVNTRRPNDQVRVVVERGGQRRTLTVKLGEQPNQVSNP